jgi:hypothetical protein
MTTSTMEDLVLVKPILRNENSKTVSVTSPSLSVISASVHDELFRKSSSFSNYARNLVFTIFDEEELRDIARNH